MKVRLANVSDSELMSSLLAKSWKSAYRDIINDRYLDSLSPTHWVEFLTNGLSSENIFAMVLMETSHIIGVSILTREDKDTANLLSFYLLPDRIGHGNGHFFYHEIELELKNRGFLKCTLDVLENNSRAIRFYESHGFYCHGKITRTTLGSSEYLCKKYEKRFFD